MFMCLKKDFYLRNGITTPAYNCQIAVSSGYIVETLICQFRSDSPAWIPFMEQFYLDYGFYPSKPVADVGYGNEENYQFNQEHGIKNVQKYSMYDRKQTSAFKKKQFQRLNWKQNSDGFYICPHQL